MKRGKILLAALLIWSLSMGGAWAEKLLCVATENCAALLDADGREIVAPGRYDDVFCVVEGERYALGIQGDDGMQYALCDASGQLLTDPVYSMFQASGQAILFRRNGLYGAMDLDGAQILPPEYTQLVTAAQGYFFATTSDAFDDDADEILLVSADGDSRFTGISSAVRLTPVRDDRMPFKDPREELYGYLNSMGDVAIEAKFETAGEFENGLARASVGGKLGVIDIDGSWLIQPEYDYLEIGEGTIIGLIGRETFVAFDAADCTERFRLEGSGLEAALVGRYPVLIEGEVMRVYTPEGDELLETSADAVLQPGADGQLILSDGEWGASCASIVSPEGVRSERTDRHLLLLDSDRYAFICMNVATYFSEVLDEIRYSCDYDSLRFGMMNAAGREILPAEYLEIRALGARRYLTVAEDGLRVVDDEGNVIWEVLREAEDLQPAS